LLLGSVVCDAPPFPVLNTSFIKANIDGIKNVIRKQPGEKKEQKALENK
jgi:hypothetical protein